jgi:hypothetical protein
MEAEESTTLTAVARRQPVKTQHTERTVRAVLKIKMCESAIALQLYVIQSCRCAINPITNPNPAYSHANA